MENFKLPHALVVVAVAMLLGFLAWQKVDSAPIVVGLVAVATGLGWVIKNQGEQGARQESISTQVNGNNAALVQTIKEQHAEFREFVIAQQRQTAAMVSDNQQHMRALADRLAEMVPPSAIPTVVTLPMEMASVSGPPANNGQASGG